MQGVAAAAPLSDRLRHLPLHRAHRLGRHVRDAQRKRAQLRQYVLVVHLPVMDTVERPSALASVLSPSHVLSQSVGQDSLSIGIVHLYHDADG